MQMAESVVLVNNKKRLRESEKDMSLCLICQKDVLKQVLCSTENGRQNIKRASEKIGDNILFDVSDDTEFRYHMTCYKPYVLKGSRAEKNSKNDDICDDEEMNNTCSTSSEVRVRNRSSSNAKDVKLCVICNQTRVKGDSSLYRICEQYRAQQFLRASRYYLDAVFQRTSMLETVENVFAADLFCHKHCINRYLLSYKRDCDRDVIEEESESADLSTAFKNLKASLQLEYKGYAISSLRQELNEKYLAQDKFITNRKMKSLLIQEFGDTVCFSYPRNRTESQMVFSSKIQSSNFAEELRHIDPIKICAETLRNDIKEFDFELDDKDCNANDLNRSISTHMNALPESWSTFCSTMFSSYYQSDHVRLKCNTVFQILFYLMHHGSKKTPLHIGISQTIHEMTRSKSLIQLCSRLGLSMSYDALERHNVLLAERILSYAEGNAVPLPPLIEPKCPIRAAMDNFDHLEQTLSGIGSSHDTVLVVFQNKSRNSAETTLNEERSFRPSKNRSFHNLLPCQDLQYFTASKQRGEISKEFIPKQRPNFEAVTAIARETDLVWSFSRFILNKYTPTSSNDLKVPAIPSWSAFNSILPCNEMPLTVTAFTPILPYPATQYDTIYTCMKNFQHCLTQVEQESGSLWSDEGVYRIAREIKLLRPDEFSNIFLGLGGFHLAKEVMACIGKYLRGSGVENIFTETETFGPDVTESVMLGKHYSRAIRGYTMLAETLQRLLWTAFYDSRQLECQKGLVEEINRLKESVVAKNSVETNEHFTNIKPLLVDVVTEIKCFIAEFSVVNETFCYWYQFLSLLFPILADLTRAQRDGNWDLNVSVLVRAVPLFFAFDKTNYSRWASVFLEDCLQLPDEYPSIFNDFKAGNFVVKNTTRKFSCVAMDQALEQNYNKPAKGSGGIIGVSRKKEAVVLHDLIKHEKVQIVQVLRDMCGLMYRDEYCLHHEFSDATSLADEQCVNRMVDFITSHGNPFDISKYSTDTGLQNIITKEKLDEASSHHVLHWKDIGERAHCDYVKDRFQDKTVSLMQPIKRLKRSVNSIRTLQVDVHKETAHALHVIDIARSREYDIKFLLKYELTSTSLFLTRNSFLTKTVKSELVHHLESKLQHPAIAKLPESTELSATVIDFMAFARKVPVKTATLKTFRQYADCLCKIIFKAAGSCERIDIIFDVYKERSIKELERSRRSQKNAVEIGEPQDDTPLPIDMNAFWASSKNKVRLQSYVIDWIMRNTTTFSNVPDIYLGGGHKADPNKCCVIRNGSIRDDLLLQSNLEEADDRMLFHVSHIVAVSKVRRVLICSTDTDVLANALYHNYTCWQNNGLKELWILYGVGKTERYIPLHCLTSDSTLTDSVLSTIPAIHCLTGCDTTSKISTKPTAIKVAEACAAEYLMDFGKQPLTEDMERHAEMYLVRTLGSDLHTMDELRFYQYHHKKIRSFQDLAPTSSTIRLHIKRSYLQCFKWMNALHTVQELDPLSYGYVEKDGQLIPKILDCEPEPEDFPKPCVCQKCFADKTCACRARKIKCCQFCKCSAKDSCCNPY